MHSRGWTPNPQKRTLGPKRMSTRTTMGSQDDSPEQLPGTTGSWGGAANCSRNSLATLRANCPASENAVNPAKGLGGPRAQAFARQEPQGGWGGPACEMKISKLRKAGARVPINTMSVLLQVGSGPGVSALEGYVPLSLQATQ